MLYVNVFLTMLFLCDAVEDYFKKEYFSAAVGLVFAIWNWNDVVQELTKTDQDV